MRVFICRSNEENMLLRKKLELLKYDVLAVDLLHYNIIEKQELYQNLADKNHDQILNIIITSKFCAKILRDQIKISCNIFIVGNESAKIIQNNDNINRMYIYSNVKELKKNLYPHINHYDKQNFIYYSGNHITEEILNVQRKIIYTTQYISDFSKNTINNFIKNPPTHILLYSKNASSNLFKILQKNNLLPLIKKSAVIGLSSSITQNFANQCTTLYSIKHDVNDMLDVLRKNS